MCEDGDEADKENNSSFVNLNVNTQELMQLVDCKGIEVFDKDNEEQPIPREQLTGQDAYFALLAYDF